MLEKMWTVTQYSKPLALALNRVLATANAITLRPSGARDSSKILWRPRMHHVVPHGIHLAKEMRSANYKKRHVGMIMNV